MRRPFRFALVLVLTLCLAIDPASACNWLMARGSACRPYRSYCQPVYPSCNPCYIAPRCGDVIVSDGCCGDSHVEHSDTPSIPTPPAGEPTPAGSRVNKPADAEMLPPAPRDPAPELRDDQEPIEPAPAEEPPAPPTQEPAPFEPADQGPVTPEEPIEQAPPVEPAPAAEDPAFDFSQPAAPAEEPAPTEEPAPSEEPAPADDGFGLFSDTPAEDAPAPAEEQPAPAEEPAPTPEPAPMEEPAPTEEPAPADDFNFFDTPAEDAPAEEAPAPIEPAPADEQPAPMEEEPAPAEEPAAEEEEGTDLENLFDFGSILTQPGGFDSLSLRRWTDNTGTYKVDARLLSVSATHVKLMKATGRTTTVPLSRLSGTDLEFVNLQASAQQADTISRTAQR